jgi:hypothetical protein
MQFIEKIVVIIGAAIIIAYLPSLFEIDESAHERPTIRTYRNFDHIITISKAGDSEENDDQ